MPRDLLNKRPTRKAIKIQQPFVKDTMPMALVPYGLYLNNGIKSARKGDVIEFFDGWRSEQRVLKSKCTVEINSSVFAFLAKLIHGEYINKTELFKRWNSVCVVEGYGRNAFNTDECVLILVEPRKSNEDDWK